MRRSGNRRDRSRAGLVIGLLVAAGWFASGYLGADDFNPTPVVSLTFVAPIADSLQYVMLSTGSTLNFGIATVGGVLAGSLVTALATGRFHLEGYQSPRHMLRSAGGAALMGAGGVMAFGCSIGQGLTGFSTLALASFIAVAGILVGTAHRPARRVARPPAGDGLARVTPQPSSRSGSPTSASGAPGICRRSPSTSCADRRRARLRS